MIVQPHGHPGQGLEMTRLNLQRTAKTLYGLSRLALGLQQQRRGKWLAQAYYDRLITSRER